MSDHSPEPERAMLQRVRAAYRQFAKAASIRREACLAVENLEERATPALTPEGFGLPLTAPEVVQFAQPSHEAAVRTDLFGVGEIAHEEDVWEFWSSVEPTAADLCAQESAPAPAVETAETSTVNESVEAAPES